jgi:membrane protein YdbS with pleckstrin-like domain
MTPMQDSVQRSAEWIYQGVWRVLADCFRVPQLPPSMPIGPADFCRSFHPSRRYLAYLKLYFWVGLVIIDLAILVGWVAVLLASPLIGWILAIPALVIAVVPDILAYIAIHLRYDTMWYVVTDRSLRTRRGIWVITEHTITFENVQNVDIRRGPIQQLFGIASVVVETAGSSEGHSENPFAVGNKAVIEGVDNAEEIRQLIMDRVRATRSAGLGDEERHSAPKEWSHRHVKLLS